MWETLIPVIIGVVIGLAPSLFTSIDAKNQRKHELKMKRIELYEAERISALIEFLRCFGAMFSGSVGDEFSTDKYMAASEKASAFVSDDTRHAIESANAYVSSHWSRHIDKADDDAVDLRGSIAKAFFSELSKPFSETYHGKKHNARSNP